MSYLDEIAALNRILPAVRARTVTPSDVADLADGPCVALNLDVDGNVAMILAGDTAAVTFYLAAGVLHPLAARRIMLTNTDAGLVITAVFGAAIT